MCVGSGRGWVNIYIYMLEDGVGYRVYLIGILNFDTGGITNDVNN